jgi:hypothetical protein
VQASSAAAAGRQAGCSRAGGSRAGASVRRSLRASRSREIGFAGLFRVSARGRRRGGFLWLREK